MVDDVGESQIEALLDSAEPHDRRIKLSRHGSAGGFASATNAALELATGEYVVFLPAGDILPDHALYVVVCALGEEDRIDLLYTDHDQIDRDGQRSDPWFKPGWDPDLLLAQDYISNLAVYRRRLVETVGLLRPNYQGAEFYDLALRVTAATVPDRVQHLPAILYRRRSDTETNSLEKALPALRRIRGAHQAVRGHLDSQGNTKALVGAAPQMPSAIRITWPFNYSALNNAAARLANGEVLLLLNNDIDIIEAGWLRELVSHALRPDVGIVGAKLIYPNETIQHGGVAFGPRGQVTHLHRFAHRSDPGYCGQLSVARTLSAVTGACVAIRRAVFFEVGGFDEINLKVGCNDIDLCLRIRECGYRVVWTPFAELFHLESVSRGYDDYAELFRLESILHEAGDADPVKRDRGLCEWRHMQQTWGAILESGDPFHNPNLLFDWDRLEIPARPRREKPWRAFARDGATVSVSASASASARGGEHKR
jgi:O-antigen biosynthesis protein